MSTCVRGVAARRVRSCALRGPAVLVLTLAVMCAAGAATGEAAAPSCPELANFATAGFSNPTAITNATFPLVPGSQLTLEGTVVRGGRTVPHRVTFTVTDVTKVIDGVRTVVIWDVDSEDGQVLESELSFFAQDDAGDVWNLGEYPEEFLGGSFIGAPSVWISGIKDAQPGIHMGPAPKVSSTFSLQGYAPDIEFEDCGRVAQLGQRTCVPFQCFDDVVVTREKDVFDPAGGEQSKFYAPGVGIVRIGAIDDPQAETLVLTNLVHLTAAALEDARVQALALDDRGYRFSDVYVGTPRAERPAAPPPPPPAPPPAAAPVAASAVLSVSTSSRSTLTRRSARGIVRRGLRARLRHWRVTRVSCRLTT